MDSSLSARPFVLALSGSVFISDALRWILVSTRDPGKEATLVQTASLGLQALVNIAFVLTIAAAIPALLGNRMPSRRILELHGAFASVNVVITIAAISMAIYVRGNGSYRLLIESFLIYLSINLVFLFWYWYADYPLREGTEVNEVVLAFDQGIRFPEETLEAEAGGPVTWRPGIIDYAYFTLLSSNCLGAPEGHMLVGRTLKSLQVVHTVFILFLFVILLARAVNTLA